MIEIRFHGRGGQGAVIGSKILATAAFAEGRFVQAFPFFGIERRGAPVTSFVRIDDKHIYHRNQIRHPDHLIILDPTLLTHPHTFEGFEGKGWILINHKQRPHDMEDLDEFEPLKGFNVATVDASEIAHRNELGSPLSPIVNTSILGAFARITNICKLDSIVEAIMEGAPHDREANAKAAREAYEEVRFLSNEPNPEAPETEEEKKDEKKE